MIIQRMSASSRRRGSAVKAWLSAMVVGGAVVDRGHQDGSFHGQVLSSTLLNSMPPASAVLGGLMELYSFLTVHYDKRTF